MEISKAVMLHTFSPKTWEVEAGRSLWVQGQPALQTEFQASQGYTEKPTNNTKWQLGQRRNQEENLKIPRIE